MVVHKKVNLLKKKSNYSTIREKTLDSEPKTNKTNPKTPPTSSPC